MKRHRRLTPSWLCVLVASCLSSNVAAAQDQQQKTDIKDMALEQLLKIEIKSVAGLTETDTRRAPVPLTELRDDAIQKSGATDINHLLEIYVPNMQFIDHHHLQAHLGMRGVISDREDKYLFQVNGRTMNNRMLMGADNERAIPLLGDIQSVSVVRGPASATHGAGAVAGVIGLQTHTGLTFQGFDVQVRGATGSRFEAGEARFGKKLSDNSGFFAYYGVADVPGASESDAPYYIGKSYPAKNGLPANVAGEPVPYDLHDFGEAAFGALRHKAHVSYVNGPFEVWGRVVQDGGQDRPMREIYTATKPDSISLDTWIRGREFLNRQISGAITFKKQLTPSFRINAMASYDDWWFKMQFMGTQTNAPTPSIGGEHEAFGRAIATWTPSAGHSLAFGAEVSRERFNDPYFSYALDRDPIVTDRQWNTTTRSFLAEYQWKPSDRFTAFLSARTDKHSFSDWLWSPRATLVFTPTDNDTFKIMGGQSVRRGCDEELWAQYWRKRLVNAPESERIAKPESLRSYGVSYDRKAGNWHVGGQAFYEDYDAIGWVPAEYRSGSIGRYKMAGGELELTYTAGKTRIAFSEGLAKLLSASIPATLPPAGEAITANPYLRADGSHYGNDLAEWAPFITKLAVLHDFSDAVTANLSFVYYSGFPGGQDFADYAATFANPPSAMPVSDAGYKTPYGPDVFLNFGVEYRVTDKLAVQANGYNLVALMDKTLSKRNFYFRLSEFNVQPASAGVSLKYRF